MWKFHLQRCIISNTYSTFKNTHEKSCNNTCCVTVGGVGVSLQLSVSLLSEGFCFLSILLKQPSAD